MATLIDISPSLSESTAVWPGDMPLTRHQQCHLEEGASVTLSGFQTTTHIGAHADAPCHYHREGLAIDKVDLVPYLGPCVVHTVQTSGAVMPEHCQSVVGQPRVLIRTQSYGDSRTFTQDFAYFAPSTIDLLGESGCQLVGIDTPSVDPFDSKDLEAHQALFRHSMRNLEGLDLSSAADGIYELIALPLRLEGFDGSPVRAILRTLDP